jgi:hypothetical protein
VSQGFSIIDSELRGNQAEFCLQQFQHRMQKKDMVIEIGVEVGSAVLASGQQSPITPNTMADKVGDRLRRDDPPGGRTHGRRAPDPES